MMDAWRRAEVRGIDTDRDGLPVRAPGVQEVTSLDDSLPVVPLHVLEQQPRSREAVLPAAQADGSDAGLDPAIRSADQFLRDLHQSPPRGFSAATNELLSTGLLVGPAYAPKSAQVHESEPPPPQYVSPHSSVREYRKAMRRESKSIISSVWNSATMSSGMKSSICEVELKDGAGAVRRRFTIVDWAELGPCAVLSTPGEPAPQHGNGWVEYMQCSHMRKAGFANFEGDMLLLSTGMQHWRVRMASISAQKWLATIYEYCHWLRPGPDAQQASGVGVGTLPAGLANPGPGSPAVARTELLPPASAGPSQAFVGTPRSSAVPATPPFCSAERDILSSLL